MKKKPQIIKPKRDQMIRFRAEEDLKSRIGKVAAKKRKTAGEFMREELWRVVENEEAALKTGGGK